MGPVVLTTFIVTLKLDDRSFEILQGWRIRHFPPARNHIPAHLTLFHALCAEQVSRLQDAWASLETRVPVPLTYVAPRFLGHGVAIDVESAALGALRTRMAAAISGSLTRQDQQPFRAHVTVQNKVEAAEAKTLYESLRSSFEPWSGEGVAVSIWQYLGGPWAFEAEHAFE